MAKRRRQSAVGLSDFVSRCGNGDFWGHSMGISVTNFSAENLQRLNITQAAGLAHFTPSTFIGQPAGRA